MPAAKTVQIDTHAIATLRYIRQSMDAAAGVAIPGSAGFAIGSIGFVAAALSLTPQLAPHWFLIWLAAAPLAAISGALLLTRPTSFASFTAVGTPGRKLALCLLPCLFAGAAMTVVLVAVERMNVVPGTWLLLYGCALISASVCTTALVAWMGVSFTMFGIAALLSSPPLQVVLLGAGFGGLHILFGILIARSPHGRES